MNFLSKLSWHRKMEVGQAIVFQEKMFILWSKHNTLTFYFPVPKHMVFR